MHRPPRPILKSNQMFPTQIRKIFTPDFFINQTQEEPIIKSMRQNIQQKQDIKTNNKTYEKQPQKVQNMQSMEINKKNNHNASQKNTNGNFYGRSFKIRNYTNHRVKENTVPINNSKKNIAVKTQHKQITTIKTNYLTENPMQLKSVILSSYPVSLDLTHLSAKINIFKIPEGNCNKIINKRFSSNTIKVQEEDILLSDRASSQLQSKYASDFSQWCIILSQNTIQGDLTSQATISKIRNLCQTFRKDHNGLTIVFKLDKQRDAELVSQIWSKNNIKVNYIIWNKQKHIERITAFNLFQLTKYKDISRIVVFQDILQFSRSYYYISNQLQFKSVDSSKKVSYLKINGIQSLNKLSLNFKINSFDDQIYLGECAYRDQTHNYMMQEQVYNKIKMAMNRKILKKKRSYSHRSNSIKQLSNQLVSGESKSLLQKNQDFKKKMIQYIKILQQDHRNRSKKSTQHLKTQPQNNNDFFQKGRSLKLVDIPKNQQSSKTPYQIIYELLKNNSLIFKQIMKYQMDIDGLELPIHSDKMLIN